MKPLNCPSCRQTMGKHPFARQLGGEVVLDVCFACQGIWLDEFESQQMTAGAVVALFHLIHAYRDEIRHPLSERLNCPRCNERLLHGQDLCKFGGRFCYHRCPQGHGRFIGFSQLMIEKGFVRQLNAGEVKQLSAQIGIVRCMGCGAPVDIRSDAACTHCRAPISILDPDAVGKALAHYNSAEAGRHRINVDMLGEAIVQHARERAHTQRPVCSGHVGDGVDLISAGIDLVTTIFGD